LILKLDEPFRNEEIFIISLFSKVQIWGFGENFFSSVFGSGYVDPHIFADPDPGSQTLADPTDPDPKHWTLWVNLIKFKYNFLESRQFALFHVHLN